jgi:hypothetical protein
MPTLGSASFVFKVILVLHPECRAVLGLALAPIIEPGRGDVRMAQPFLHFGDVGFVGEGIGRSRRA